MAQAEYDFRGTERFEVLARLGTGSSGVVYHVFDRERAQDLALKALRFRDARAVSRFREEFSSCRDIEHPNLVRFEELFENDGQWFFTMELVRGVDFVSHVCPRLSEGAAHTFDEARLRDGLAQLFSSLHALHLAGRVHRDVKPSNVRVTPDGRVVLLDFGLSAKLHEDQGGALGTPHYCAPEQALNEPVYEPADFYGVGVMLHEALTGKRPFEGPVQRVLELKVSGEAPGDVLDAAHPPSDLSALCRALLKRDPHARPTGAELVRWGRHARGTWSRAPAPSPAKPSDDALNRLLTLGRESDRKVRRVVIVGPPGSGKRALIDAFASTLRAEGQTTLVRVSAERVEAHALAWADAWLEPLAEKLSRSRFATERSSCRGASILGEIFPVLARSPLVEQASRSDDGSGDALAKLAGARSLLCEGLAGLTHEKPLVLLLEGSERMDEDSRAWLCALLRERNASLLVVETRRELSGAADHETLSLSRVDGPTMAGFSALSAEARALFVSLCVLSDQTTPMRLAEVSDVEKAVLASALAELRLTRLVREVGLAGERLLQPIAPELHERVLRTISVEQRAKIAARWAMLLGPRGGTSAVRLAIEGGLHEQAKSWAEEAALHARRRYAVHAEAALHEQALIAVPAESNARGRQRLSAFSEALIRAGKPAPAGAALLSAAQSASSGEAIELRRRGAECLLQAGHIDAGLKALDDLLRFMGMPPMPTPARSITSFMWNRTVLGVRGRGYSVRSEAELPPRKLTELDVTWSVGRMVSVAKTMQGVDFQTRSLRLALTLGEKRRVARALATEASFRAGIEAPPQREGHNALSEARKLVAECGDAFVDASCDVSAALLAFHAMRMHECLEYALSAERKLEALSEYAMWERAFATSFRLSALAQLCRLSELDSVLSSALADAELRGDRFGATMLRASVAPYAEIAHGVSEDAERVLTETLDAWSRAEFHFLHFYEVLGLGHLDLYRAHPGGEQRLSRAWPSLERAGMLRIVPVRLFLLRFRAAFVLMREGPLARSDLRRVRADAASIARVKHRGGEAFSALIRAGAFAREGQNDKAAVELATAISAFEGTGLEIWKASAELALGTLTGGDEGRIMRERAEARLMAGGVKDPVRFAHVFATGCVR